MATERIHDKFLAFEAIEALKPEVVQASDFLVKSTDGKDLPSEEAIEAKRLELVAEHEAKEYFYRRMRAYPAIGKQLDALYHDIVNGNLSADTSTFVALVNETKAEFPKP